MKQRTPTGNEDVNVFHCKRCGFPCDLSRDKTGPGSGLRYVEISHTSATAPHDPQVTAGCPKCGTKNFKHWQQ